MLTTNCKLFWPRYAATSRLIDDAQAMITTTGMTPPPLYLVGWNDNGAVVVVAGVVARDDLDLARHAPGLSYLGEMHVVTPSSSSHQTADGNDAPASPTTPTTPTSVGGTCGRRHRDDMWLVLHADSTTSMALTSMYLCGYRCVPFEAQIYVYDPTTPYNAELFGGAARRMNLARSTMRQLETQTNKAISPTSNCNTTGPSLISRAAVAVARGVLKCVPCAEGSQPVLHTFGCIRARARRVVHAATSVGYSVSCEAIDVLVGLCFVQLLLLRADDVVACVEECIRVALYEGTLSYLEWFRGWPAGFKTNQQLSDVLADTATLGMKAYPSLILRDGGSVVVGFLTWAVLLSGCGGISLMLAALADAITALCLPVSILHSTVAHLYCTMVTAIASLFRVFSSKKKNPLRGNRVDTLGSFELDRLLLGTVIFTPLCFLFPTVALYYGYFTLVVAALRLVLDVLALGATLQIHNPAALVVVYLLERKHRPASVRIGQPQLSGASLPTRFTSSASRGVTSMTVLTSLPISLARFSRAELLPVGEALQRSVSKVGMWVRTLRGSWEGVASIPRPSLIE